MDSDCSDPICLVGHGTGEMGNVHWALGKRTWGQGERLVSSSHLLSPCPQVSPAPSAPHSPI
jgi:hypothetical protein